MDGIRWRTRTGSPWRDVATQNGHGRTIYGRHRRWSGEGTYGRVLDALRAGADRDPAALDAAGAWAVSIDFSVVRAHADAAGARAEPPGDVPAELLDELAALAAPPPARGGGASGGEHPAAAA